MNVKLALTAALCTLLPHASVLKRLAMGRSAISANTVGEYCRADLAGIEAPAAR